MDKQLPPSPSPSSKPEGLTFPCEFTIKVFGKTSDEFEPHVRSLIGKHQPHLSENAIRQNPSKDGKYLALSIIVHVDSREQLDAIYRELTASSAVLMAL